MQPARLASSQVFFLIRRLYYTFINRLSDFHMLKHINRLLKSNRLKIKALYIGLFIPAVLHTVSEDLIQFGYADLISQILPRKGRKIFIYINQTRRIASYS